ncbi:MAG: electron transport complex subunit E [Clostridiales bacterium]|nr:electron transport complex subunit E [Clostridiales bacterium]
MAKTTKKAFQKTLTNGIVTENPIFRLALGMCPTLAITTMAINGVSMGLATMLVLVCSNFVISLVRNIIPENVRIPAFVIIIASFVTILQMLIKAFVPILDKTLGIYIPLIVVNCIIFARAEAFAFTNPPFLSVVDGLGMGLGFTGALTLLASFREILGMGTIFGFQLLPAGVEPFGIFSLPPGGFLSLGLLMAAVNGIAKIIEKKKSSTDMKGEIA